MAAESSSKSNGGPVDSYIGSHINLISKSEIRYEGILSDINASESSIGLRNVRSFGTEGRKKDGPQLPPSDKVYEYILFRGSDIKDLQVKSSPTVGPSAPLYKDPAIIESHHSQGTGMSTSSTSTTGFESQKNLDSKSPQTGLPNSTFQGSLPLYQPGGSSGLWGFPHPPMTNGSNFPMPAYLQGFHGASNGPQVSQQARMQQPVASASKPSGPEPAPVSNSPPFLLPPFSTGKPNSNTMPLSESSALPTAVSGKDKSAVSRPIPENNDKRSMVEASGSFLSKGSSPPPLVTPSQLLQLGPTQNQNFQPGPAPNKMLQPGPAPNQLLQPGPAPNKPLQPGPAPNQFPPSNSNPSRFLQPGFAPNQFEQPGPASSNQLLQPVFAQNRLLQPGAGSIPSHIMWSGPGPGQLMQPGTAKSPSNHSPNQLLQPGPGPNQPEQTGSGPNQLEQQPGSLPNQLLQPSFMQNRLLQFGPGPTPGHILQSGPMPGPPMQSPIAKPLSNYGLGSTQKDVEVVQASSIGQSLPAAASQPPLLPTPLDYKVPVNLEGTKLGIIPFFKNV